jgi:hypothetical protein
MMLQAARASVDETSRGANLAMYAIATVGALDALECAFNDLDAPGILCQLVGYVAWVVAAVLYCRWLYHAYGDIVLLQGSPLRFKPREAVVSFFLPFVAVYRPYRVLVDLHEASDPRSIWIPSTSGLETNAATSSTYARLGEGRVRAGDSGNGWEKVFPARSWWALWLLAPLITGILDSASALTQLTSVTTLSAPSAMLLSPEGAGDGLLRVLAALVHLALAALAIAVVRSIVARQRERVRRLETTLPTSTTAS